MTKARCSFKGCNSVIIDINASNSVRLPDAVFDIFQLVQFRKEHKQISDVNKNNFLLVNDVWDFDNIGVSKQIPPTFNDEHHKGQEFDNLEFEYNGEKLYIKRCLKYLICADCDRGPIGFVCQVSKHDYEATPELEVYLLSLEPYPEDAPDESVTSVPIHINK